MNIVNEANNKKAAVSSEEIHGALQKSIREAAARLSVNTNMSGEETEHLQKLTELTITGLLASVELTAEANGVEGNRLTVAVLESIAAWDRRVNALMRKKYGGADNN